MNRSQSGRFGAAHAAAVRACAHAQSDTPRPIEKTQVNQPKLRRKVEAPPTPGAYTTLPPWRIAHRSSPKGYMHPSYPRRKSRGAQIHPQRQERCLRSKPSHETSLRFRSQPIHPSASVAPQHQTNEILLHTAGDSARPSKP